MHITTNVIILSHQWSCLLSLSILQTFKAYIMFNSINIHEYLVYKYMNMHLICDQPNEKQLLYMITILK